MRKKKEARKEMEYKVKINFGSHIQCGCRKHLSGSIAEGEQTLVEKLKSTETYLLTARLMAHRIPFRGARLILWSMPTPKISFPF